MKMVMLIVDAHHSDDIQHMFDECDVPGYTEIGNTHGKGASGKKTGSRAFPGASNVFFAAMEDHCIQPLRERLAALRTRQGPEEGLKAFILEIQEII
jgi:hypothetical protein